MGADYRISRAIQPFVGIDLAQTTGDLKWERTQTDRKSGALVAESPLSFQGGVVFEFTKLTIGLTAFAGNQTGAMLTFFSTPKTAGSNKSNASNRSHSPPAPIKVEKKIPIEKAPYLPWYGACHFENTSS